MSLSVDLLLLINIYRYDKALTSLGDTLATLSEDVRCMRGEVQGLTRGQLSSHFIQLDPRPEYVPTAFSPEELQRVSESYVEHAHPLHPFFDRPQQMCNEFISSPALQKGTIEYCLRNAQVLFFLALGSCRSIAHDTGRSSTPPGIVYYSYGKSILNYKSRENNVPAAQALTLAALYMNKIGNPQDSLAYLCEARDIYTNVVTKWG